MEATSIPSVFVDRPWLNMVPNQNKNFTGYPAPPGKFLFAAWAMACWSRELQLLIRACKRKSIKAQGKNCSPRAAPSGVYYVCIMGIIDSIMVE